MSSKTANSRVRRSLAKPLLAGLALGLGVLAAAPSAQADVVVGVRYGGWGWHHPYYRRHFFFGPRIVFWGPPVYYGPPPYVYGPPVGPPVYAPGYGVPQQQPMTVNPTSAPYRASNGLTCREFQTTITVGGQAQPAYGTACLQPDGSWKVVDR